MDVKKYLKSIRKQDLVFFDGVKEDTLYYAFNLHLIHFLWSKWNVGDMFGSDSLLLL